MGTLFLNKRLAGHAGPLSQPTTRTSGQRLASSCPAISRQTAHSRRGAKDRGEHRQAAGAVKPRQT